MGYFAQASEYTGTNPDPERFFKSTIFQSPNFLAGMDCLLPGQFQHAHRHAGRDKVYYIVAGAGEFPVGGETQHCGVGMVVWAPAGVEHGVRNLGGEPLVMFIVMAPEPG